MRLFGFLVLALTGCTSISNQRLPLTSDYCVLSVEEDGGSLAVLDRDGERLATVAIGERPHEVEVTADGHTAFVSQFGIADYDNRIGTPGNKVVAIDLVRGRTIGSYLLPNGLRAPHGVKLRPPAQRELFTNAEAGGDVMLVYDVASRALRRRFNLPKATHNFIFSPNGNFLISFAGVNGVARFDAATGRLLAERKFATPVRGLRFQHDGSLLASAKGEVLRLDPTTLETKEHLVAPVRGQFVYLESLEGNRVVAPSLDDGGVVLFVPSRTPRFITTGKAPIFVRRAPDGFLFVANVDDDHLTVMNDRGGDVRSFGSVKTPNGLAFAACHPKQRLAPATVKTAKTF